MKRLVGILAAMILAVGPAHSYPISMGGLGPFNAEFPAGGDGLNWPLPGLPVDTPLPAGEPWTVAGWISPSEPIAGATIVGGVGSPTTGGRFLTLTADGVGAWTGVAAFSVKASVGVNRWRFVAAASHDGQVDIYLDGQKIGGGAIDDSAAKPRAVLAPRGVSGFAPYAGRIAGFTVWRRALSAGEVAALSVETPNAALIAFDTGSPHWPVQTRQMIGQVAPQDAWTLPFGSATPSKSTIKPPYRGLALVADGANQWTLKRWSLAAAPSVNADGATLSRDGVDTTTWYEATVPGTVLTTLVDRGVYPDPDYGLNNLAIPESLNKQDYWYRTAFETPAAPAGRHALLTLKGINYAAEAWLNGARVGTVRGAFIRGRFDVTDLLKASGRNVLAIKVSPPPHPGIAQEESISAGPGENGGMEALDGPTFIASEGWDWIPSVRDRNTGLWQDVTLGFTGDIRLGDPQVVTTLPAPDNHLADVEITVPVENLADTARTMRVVARFGAVNVAQTAIVPPGKSILAFAPKAFPALEIHQPSLWWPNGYGPQSLQDLTVTADVGGEVSDERRLRFGIRQITYELSLMDPSGHVRRVDVDFARARQLGENILDVRHEAIRKVPGGWVESLTSQGARSPAVTDVANGGPAPYLVLKVNGVKIAARGGNWGTDDWRKRVGRERMEPFFRLHKEAHLNIIRNWVGQNTEDVFYDLADEYGLLVLNDFWASTQDYQVEPQDVPLFLANAADVVARYRNHPSIAVWFGRNEGVPQPILNEGLEAMIHDLDGTRWYTGSSNRIELQDSGPYDYRAPAGYFTDYAKGFAVEVGTPSFPTLEAFEAAAPEADRWPMSDTWAYHDWHQAGNGAVASFMRAMAGNYGEPRTLEDFERKAQLMNYETHRAMFEGMNAGLWTRNSGRLLWMTQPAWPSTAWQILSHDYDTHAAFYGVKSAAEPVHVQLNLADHRVDVVNNTVKPIRHAVVASRVMALDGRVLTSRSWPVDVEANATSHGPQLSLEALLTREDALIVRLDLAGADGKALSHNLYWLTAGEAGGRKLAAMSAQPISISARAGPSDGGERSVAAVVRNDGSAAALNAKLTLTDAAGRRILPAYYSDNYVSLMPGESRTIEIRFPTASGPKGLRLGLRGWNVIPSNAELKP